MPIELRESVRWFAGQMELKLRKHDDSRGSSGWKDCDNKYLLSRLFEEYLELVIAARDSGDIIPEAVDVANFAMMIADNAMFSEGK